MLGDIVAPSSCLHRNLTQASMGLRIVWIEQRVFKEHLSTESLPGSHRTPPQLRAKSQGLLEGVP